MRILIFLVSIFSTLTLSAQNMLSLYNMKHIPQVVYTNPATTPLGRLNISVPGLGSDYTNFGKSNFTTNGITTTNSNGYPTLDVTKFVEGLEDNNLLFASGNFEAFHLGFTAGKNYIFFNVTDRITSEFNFPKEAAMLITEVFTQIGFNTLEIKNLALQYTHVREFGFGFNRKVNNKLNVGFRLKAFNGIANFQTLTTGLVVNTRNREILDALVDVDIRTSGLERYRELITEPNVIVETPNNWGYALDLGIEYQFNAKMKAAVSATDIMGAITWKDNVNNYNAENVLIDFTTIDWSEVIKITSDSGVFNGFYDSILNNTEASDVKRAYQTVTPTKIYGSYTYSLTPKIEATILGQVVFTDNYFQEYVRIGIQGRVKRFLNYMVSYAIIDDRESAQNLGLGLALNLGPVQVHALTDNIFDPFLLQSDFNPSLRFGLNLTFGRDFQ